MNGNTIKIIAVVAVIVVVAGGVGAVMFFNKPTSRDYKIDAALEVYGNADGDYKIDNADLEIIQNIADGKEGYTLEKYPLANAYKADDVVDDKDIDQVKKIIAGGKEDGNPMIIWHINHSTDTTTYPSGQYVAETNWPIKKAIANGAANSLLLYEMVGIGDNIVGINYSSSSPPDSIVYKKYHDMESLGTSTTKLTESKVKACIKANVGTTAVITADNSSYLKTGCNEAYLEGTLMLDVVRIQHAAVDPKEHASAILLLGFLFQKETKAYEASEWVSSVYKEINEKIADVSKVRVAVSSGEKYVSAKNSDYADVAVQAGGVYTYWEQSTTSIYFRTYEGTSTTYDPHPNVYREEYQPDIIIGLRTGSVLGSASSGASWYGPIENWDKPTLKGYVADFEDFNCYGQKKIWVVSGDMPIVARVLCTAAILYPDQVSMDWANEKHQEYVDKFLGGLYNVNECHFVLSQKEVEEL